MGRLAPCSKSPGPKFFQASQRVRTYFPAAFKAFRMLRFVPPCAEILFDVCGILCDPISEHIGLGFAKLPKLDWIAYARCLPTFLLKYRTGGHGLGLATFVVFVGVVTVVCDVCLQTLLAHWRQIRNYFSHGLTSDQSMTIIIYEFQFVLEENGTRGDLDQRERANQFAFLQMRRIALLRVCEHISHMLKICVRTQTYIYTRRNEIIYVFLHILMEEFSP